MNNEEILSLTALSAMGLCLLCILAKMMTKNDKAKKRCDQVCSLLVFISVVLVGVSQLVEGFQQSGRDTLKTSTDEEIGEPDCASTKCQNGGVAAPRIDAQGAGHKWPVGDGDVANQTTACGCNCVGGYSGDTCEIPPFCDTTSSCTTYPPSPDWYKGLSTQKCDPVYSDPFTSGGSKNACWRCKYGHARPSLNGLDGNDYCCESEHGFNSCAIPEFPPSDYIQGKKICATEAGTTKYCESDEDCGNYSTKDGEEQCTRMDMPASNIIPPKIGCDRRSGYSNPCCQCKYGILRYGGEDFCCSLKPNGLPQDNCEWPGGIIPPGNKCDSRPGNPFPCWMCEYGHYKWDLDDFCANKPDPTIPKPSTVCDTRPNYPNQCSNCPYGSIYSGFNDWCCKKTEGCHPAPTSTSKMQRPSDWNKCE